MFFSHEFLKPDVLTPHRKQKSCDQISPPTKKHLAKSPTIWIAPCRAPLPHRKQKIMSSNPPSYKKHPANAPIIWIAPCRAPHMMSFPHRKQIPCHQIPHRSANILGFHFPTTAPSPSEAVRSNKIKSVRANPPSNLMPVPSFASSQIF